LSFPSPSEFYKQFRDAPEVAKRTAFGMGQKFGEALLQRCGIEGEGLEVVAELLNEAMRTVRGEPSARVEGDRVILRNQGFCGVMRSALTLNVPWEWLDVNFAWPWLEGIVSTIRPDIEIRIPSARCRGDEACIHVFEVERG